MKLKISVYLLNLDLVLDTRSCAVENNLRFTINLSVVTHLSFSVPDNLLDEEWFKWTRNGLRKP